MDQGYRICNKCIMDTTDHDIYFDDKGICNHCHSYLNRLEVRLNQDSLTGLNNIIDRIKNSGRSKKYDCVIGVSGGVDSTYVANLCKQKGLRPLAVHFDNGWNSELAVSNIEKVLKNLDIDLYTYVVDWEEFKELQLSFLYASTPDSEIPTDHAIYAILFRIAAKYNIKYIVTGMNFKTESILPVSWSYGHSDWRYIKNIQKKFGKRKLRSFPHYSMLYLFYIYFIKRIKMVSILNYIDYNKDEALDLLEKDLGWRNYGGKHHESIYTRFFQSYILPNKFNIDKRRAHLSNLILSKQMTREETLKELKNEACSSEIIKEDKEFVIKKFEISEDEFEKIIETPPKLFYEYKNNYNLIQAVRKLIYLFRQKGILPK